METMEGHPSGRASTRALGALLVVGAVLSASTLLLPAEPGIERLAIGLLDALTLAAGVVLRTAGTKLLSGRLVAVVVVVVRAA